MTTEATGQPGAGPNASQPGAGGTGGAGASGTGEASSQSTKSAEGDTKEPDGANWDDATKDYIKRLRTENAERRTKYNDLEKNFGTLKDQFTQLQTGMAKALGIDTEATPEEQVEALTHQAQTFESENALLHLMLDKGIKSDNKDYFMFLMEKKASSLGENEELTEDMINDIVKEVNVRSGNTSQVDSGSTSVGGNGQQSKAPSGGNGQDVTIEEFAGMTISQKSQLYQTNPQLYSTLMNQYAQQV